MLSIIYDMILFIFLGATSQEYFVQNMYTENIPETATSDILWKCHVLLKNEKKVNDEAVQATTMTGLKNCITAGMNDFEKEFGRPMTVIFFCYLKFFFDTFTTFNFFMFIFVVRRNA